ncbi:hypothetical protein E2I00_019726, partial [Balaenoptera physalus]
MVSSPENHWTSIASVTKFLCQNEFDELDFGSTLALVGALLRTSISSLSWCRKCVKLLNRRPRVAGIPNIQSGYEIPPPVPVSDNTPYTSSVYHLCKRHSSLVCLLFRDHWKMTVRNVFKSFTPLDYIHVMTHDLQVPGRATLDRTAVSTNTQLTLTAMPTSKDNGSPAEKLIVGFPAYELTIILSNPCDHEIHAATNGPGSSGSYTRQSGFWAYYEVFSWKLERGGN